MSLLEVLIALVILVLATVGLFEAAGSGLHATRSAALYDQAIVRAKSHLAAASHGTKLIAGESSGDDGGGFYWRLRIAPAGVATLRPTAIVDARAAGSVVVTLYSVSVWIDWKGGNVRLDSEQVGG